jgi:predicted RNase H-like HicB family nuclease
VEQTGYHVILEPDPEGGYIAVVPAFPGCYSQGETADEALSKARDAILLTIEDMRERGDAIPDPAGELVHRVAVGANEGSQPFDHMGIPPTPAEFSAESDPLAWEGEGGS